MPWWLTLIIVIAIGLLVERGYLRRADGTKESLRWRGLKSTGIWFAVGIIGALIYAVFALSR